MSKELGFMTSENILFCIYHLEGVLTRVHLHGQSSRRGSEFPSLSVWLCQLSREFVIRDPNPEELCQLNLHCLLVLESPSISD